MVSTGLVLLLFVASSYAKLVGSPQNYHTLVGIPTAQRIKAWEDALPSDNSRIYFGKVVDIEEHPYFASYLIHFSEELHLGFSYCGSSLVSSNRLITAAHCLINKKLVPERMTVVLGSSFLTKGGLRIETSEIYTHPKFYIKKFDNDIAVIYLPYEVQFEKTISPMSLPSGSELQMSFAGHWANTSGIGFTESEWHNVNRGDYPLRSITVTVISNAECLSHWRDIIDSKICANGDDRRVACQGDSGGPLTTYTNRNILIGVVSNGPIPCGSGHPVTYTRISSFMDFINNHVKI